MSWAASDLFTINPGRLVFGCRRLPIPEGTSHFGDQKKHLHLGAPPPQSVPPPRGVQDRAQQEACPGRPSQGQGRGSGATRVQRPAAWRKPRRAAPLAGPSWQCASRPHGSAGPGGRGLGGRTLSGPKDGRRIFTFFLYFSKSFFIFAFPDLHFPNIIGPHIFRISFSNFQQQVWWFEHFSKSIFHLFFCFFETLIETLTFLLPSLRFFLQFFSAFQRSEAHLARRNEPQFFLKAIQSKN